MRSCALEVRAAVAECYDAGHSRGDCMAKAIELYRACRTTECKPMPSCDERCKAHGKQLLRRCINAGGDLERCRHQAKMATESCLEENCRDCICPDVYAPVCGVDGMTYGNACEASCARVQVRHEGPCEPVCLPLPCDVFCEYGHKQDPNGCPTCECNPPPGCDSDADCDQDHACRKICSLRPCRLDEPNCPECSGVCLPTPQLCLCPDIYDPVCGVDGRTFSNACFARCANVEVGHDGACRDHCRHNSECDNGDICHPRSNQCQPRCAIQCFVADPVCGEDGITYVCGEADANCSGVAVDHPGECGLDCSLTSCGAVQP